jgi:hypothetical protein
MVLATIGKTAQRCEPSFLPSEYVWIFRYVFEVAIPTLVGSSTVEHTNQINTNGDRQMYNPLTNCILDKNSP